MEFFFAQLWIFLAEYFEVFRRCGFPYAIGIDEFVLEAIGRRPEYFYYFGFELAQVKTRGCGQGVCDEAGGCAERAGVPGRAALKKIERKAKFSLFENEMDLAAIVF